MENSNSQRDPAAIRVGAVAYLNTKPLIWRLAQRAPEVQLVLDVPSRLADGLAAGDLDVALVPSIECFRARPPYRIVPGVSIAARGPVLSVKLFSRVDFSRIKTLALDEGSRTSIALVQILLAKRWGVRPEMQPLPLGASAADAATDAVLLIGDRAIHGADGEFAHALDLGAAWVEWTGLPCVFAVWAVRPGADLRGIDRALRQARDEGMAHIDEIAAVEGPAVGISPERCRRYLTENLHYDFGFEERTGLERFYGLACEVGLAPKGVELVDYHEPCAAKSR